MQIGEVIVLLWLLNYNFSPVSCSFDNSSTICYLEVAPHIFPNSSCQEMAFLPLTPNNYNFSKLAVEETVHANVKIGLSLCIADCLFDCLLYCSSHFSYLPAVKKRV